MLRVVVLAGVLALSACGNGTGGEDVAAPAPVAETPAPAPAERQPAVPAVDPLPAPPLGDVASLVTLGSEGFVENGYFIRSAPTSELISGVVGSYGEGGDSVTGQVAFEITLPADSLGLALPLITGPDPTTASVTASCGETSQALDVVFTTDWTWVPVSTDACAPGAVMTLTVADAGSDWGQWIAVGQPRLVLPAQN